VRTTYLDSIFAPESIAVIDTGEQDSGTGSVIIRNLIETGYRGKVYPINPHCKMIRTLAAYPSLADLPHPVDLAIMGEPIVSASRLLKECKQAGVKGLVMISPQGKESPAQDLRLKPSFEKEAKSWGIHFIGPNSYGIFCGRTRLNASLACQTPLSGKMAFVCQSSAICASVIELCVRECIGISHLVSLGDMHGLDFGDIIDYLGEDFEVSSIVLCIEHLNRYRNFMSAARAVSRVKPIVALKVGRTRGQANIPDAWRARDIDSDAVYDAAFKRAGIVRVKTFQELVDCSELLAKQPRPSGPGLAIVTNAAVLGAMAVDALFDYDVTPVKFGPETIQNLDGLFKSCWSRANPVVISEDLSVQDYGRMVDVCLKAAEVQGLMLILTPQIMTNPMETASFLSMHLKRKAYPVLTSWMGGPDAEKQREIFNRAGLTTFDTPERAVQAFMYLYRYAHNIEMLQEIPPKLTAKLVFDRPKARTLIEHGLNQPQLLLAGTEAKNLISAYGIPVDPVAKDPEYELCVGSQTDPDFGPVIFFGIGGSMAALSNDRAVALPPLNRLLARRLMQETKVFYLLQGEQNLPPCDVTLFEEILIRLSQLITDFAEIERLEINPLAVKGNQVWAADARIRLKPSRVPAPLHLLISPYPNEFETQVECKDVGKLIIRPIRPEDAPLMVELFESLSPHSIYLRFFSQLKRLPHKMLARFTQIDYAREIALVAIQESESGEKMLGVARIITVMDPKKAEFSTIVGDPWQGKGIGTALLKRCLRIAKDRGIENVWGLVLPENTQMLALGRKLNFKVKRTPDFSEYELNIDLTQPLDF